MQMSTFQHRHQICRSFLFALAQRMSARGHTAMSAYILGAVVTTAQSPRRLRAFVRACVKSWKEKLTRFYARGSLREVARGDAC